MADGLRPPRLVAPAVSAIKKRSSWDYKPADAAQPSPGAVPQSSTTRRSCVSPHTPRVLPERSALARLSVVARRASSDCWARRNCSAIVVSTLKAAILVETLFLKELQKIYQSR